MKSHIATDQEIKRGKTTDIYFDRAVKILKKEKIRKKVTVEIAAKSLPYCENWAIFAGLEEALHLLEKLPVEVKAMREGSVFYPNEPVMTVEGSYEHFAVLETALLGYLCQASGVATKAARCRKACGDKTLLNFGTRRMHPAISPMLDRNAFIGGCDSVSTLKGGELIGVKPQGTMPHSLILLKGDTVEAAKSFDRFFPASVKRIALIDTFNDEKFEAVRVAEALGKKLDGVRLDTPSSRRGNFLRILQEVRWELDLRGFEHVQIFVSGGLDEEEILSLREVADGFGVGTALCNAPVIDFALDIVEVEGEPRSKRGKCSGAKKCLRCPKCRQRGVIPDKGKKKTICLCSGRQELLNFLVLRHGKKLSKGPLPQEIRKLTIKELKSVEICH